MPHNRLTFDQTEIDAVSSVVRSGMWAGGAQQVAMEERLCRMFRVINAIGVGSGLAGLRLALLACSIKENDEILIPAYSCVALPNAVLSV
ncbi:MAG: DegT/DnrJ/EryC1/StrS aminotransferase family protein, partial [Acidobacteriales bacterium]|nr:DegT/DnrJ/EryC1/StrS aminotransferase family protein [Terriglobales bacterium]